MEFYERLFEDSDDEEDYNVPNQEDLHHLRPLTNPNQKQSYVYDPSILQNELRNARKRNNPKFNDDHFLASFHLDSDMNRLNENQKALSYKPAPVNDTIIRSTPQYDSNKIIILSTLCFVVMILIILLLIALFYLNN